jgi:hypothetical protein
MRIPFHFTLEGRDWWKSFLPVWAIYLVYMGLTQAANLGFRGRDFGAPYFITLFVVLLAFIAVTSAFTIIILRIVLPKLSLADKGFEFGGEVGRFVGMVFLGTLLSVITLGVYLPWFSRKIVAYLASETRVGGEKPVFLGRPLRLLLIFLPFIILIAALVGLSVYLSYPGLPISSASYASGQGRPATLGGGTMAMVSSLITFGLIVLIYAPFIYLIYRWYVDFSLNNAKLRWATKFWPSCLFLLGQLCLTLVTLGIYWPAACLRIWRYFASRTVIEKEGVETARFGFDGPLGRGFGLLWGQALLCLITLGFYIPWAYARVGRFVLEHSWYEGETAPAPVV